MNSQLSIFCSSSGFCVHPYHDTLSVFTADEKVEEQEVASWDEEQHMGPGWAGQAASGKGQLLQI